MNTEEYFNTCLRVVSNRCRNVRKAIDRAKTWEKAAKEGQVLNDGQLESVNSLWKKEAILAELEEILKKQTSIAKEAITNGNKSNGNHKKILKSMSDSQNDKSSANQESYSEKRSESSSNSILDNTASHSQVHHETDQSIRENSSETSSVSSSIKQPDVQPDAIREKTVIESVESPATKSIDLEQPNGDTEHTSNSEKDKSLSLSLGEEESTQKQVDMEKKIEILEKKLSETGIKHLQQLTREKMKLTRTILNIFHIGDFCRQEGSREALLAYYDSESGRKSGRTLSNLDIDLFCYFHTMLTTPNGVVPHNEAVGVSTTHCINLINKSPLEAFRGTSYSKLIMVIDTISTCPILTERGKTPSRGGGGPRRGRGGYGRGRGRDRQKMTGSNNTTPNHNVRDATALSESQRTS